MKPGWDGRHARRTAAQNKKMRHQAAQNKKAGTWRQNNAVKTHRAPGNCGEPAAAEWTQEGGLGRASCRRPCQQRPRVGTPRGLAVHCPSRNSIQIMLVFRDSNAHKLFYTSLLTNIYTLFLFQQVAQDSHLLNTLPPYNSSRYFSRCLRTS